MTRAETIEVLAGLGLLAAGLYHYVGWPPVALGYGVLLVLGGLISMVMRQRQNAV